MLFGYGACFPPSQRLPGNFPWGSLRGLELSWGPPFWGSSGGSFGLHTWLPTGHDFEKAFCQVRRFVVLKHDLRHFCLFWLGCAPEPALSKDSPPISVRSSEASIPPFLDRPINVRRGWACPFSLRHTFFLTTMMVLRIFFIAALPCVHASPCSSRHVIRLCVMHSTRIHSRSRPSTSPPLWPFVVWSHSFGWHSSRTLRISLQLMVRASGRLSPIVLMVPGESFGVF